MQYHFIVTSAIDLPKKKLSYTDTRSVFSVEERLEQTKQTINSIKKHAPGASITLIELGLTDYTSSFQNSFGSSVQVLYKGKSTITAWIVRSRYKGLGETIGIFHALSHVPQNTLCFKLSGRYELTEQFEHVPWNTDLFNFKSSGYSFSTRLYAFPSTKKFTMHSLLIASIPFLLLNRSIERVYKILLPKKLTILQPTLGVRGLIAVDRTYIEE